MTRWNLRDNQEDENSHSRSYQRSRFGRRNRSLSVEINRIESSENHPNFHSDEKYFDDVSPELLPAAPSNTLCNWSKSKEEEELDDYIYKTQLDNILKNYIAGVKRIISLLFVFALILIAIYHTSELDQTPSGKVFIEQTYFFMAYLVA